MTHLPPTFFGVWPSSRPFLTFVYGPFILVANSIGELMTCPETEPTSFWPLIPLFFHPLTGTPSGSGLATVPTQLQLDITTVEAALEQFLDAGLASSTRKVYSAGWNRYLRFTRQFQLLPVPVSMEKVTLFVTFLGSQGLAVFTIESYLAALHHVRLMSDPYNISPSFHSPHMAVLLHRIRRSQSVQGPHRVRLPITATSTHQD